jgi:hypothetical protein
MADHILTHMRRCPLTETQAARLLELDADISTSSRPPPQPTSGGVDSILQASVETQLREMRHRALAVFERTPFDHRVRCQTRLWPVLKALVGTIVAPLMFGNL